MDSDLLQTNKNTEIIMSISAYQFDVAISFLAKDEAVATQLADQFKGRLRVFLYSRQQEQLAGTDGEKTFNDVFGTQARMVVVLYREGWGQTPWTRIEETAIRNRAFDDGYGFVVFIPLDDKPTVPKWLPRTQLWIGLGRWGVTGAASVVDARFQELGGEPAIESIEQRASRVERALTYEKQRKTYLGTDAGVRGANHSFDELKEAILTAVPGLQAVAPSLRLSSKQQGQQVVLLSENPALLVDWRNRYSNTLSDSVLEASAWQGHPPFPGVQHWDKPKLVGKISMSPDLALDGSHAWSMRLMQGEQLLNGKNAAEHIIAWWLDKYAMPERSQ